MREATIIDERSGIRWTAVLVEQGDAYGYKDSILHDKPDPLVEFWDGRAAGKEGFHSVRGQFVARYYLSTLTTDSRWSQPAVKTGRGLNLDAGEPSWQISGPALREVMAALTGKTHTEW